jgi:cellulose synthase/poly-beta-1,6-N-acetylglucosamine synthase-like glycosyltransferase
MSEPESPSSTDRVSLVIPAKNAASTLRPCLDAVAPLVAEGALEEILLVDDGSTDDTAAIAAEYPVRVLRTGGIGRGGARNLGWREVRSPLIWFIDSDCVAEPDALALLRPPMADPKVAAVGGSYGNMRPESLIACLIHEEIVERHRVMPSEVDFLATFNVLYRRSVLAAVGGFNERYLRAQDAELAFRVKAHGETLRFEARSRVKHFHSRSLPGYLRAQRHQGYWRVWLYFDYPGRAGGDAYSGGTDHIQPPLAMVVLGCLPLAAAPLLFPAVPWLGAALPALAATAALAASQIPMTTRLVRATGQTRYLLFAPFSFLRAFYRGIGMTHGVLAVLRNRILPTDAASTGQPSE